MSTFSIHAQYRANEPFEPIGSPLESRRQAEELAWQMFGDVSEFGPPIVAVEVRETTVVLRLDR